MLRLLLYFFLLEFSSVVGDVGTEQFPVREVEEADERRTSEAEANDAAISTCFFPKRPNILQFL